MKKKLLITTESFIPRWDGISRFLTLLLPKLKGFSTTVIAPKFKGKTPKIPGVKIIQQPLLKIMFGDLYFSQWCYKQVKEVAKDHDIIFTQSIGPIGSAGIRAAKKFNKTAVAYLHNIEWELAAKSVKRFNKICEWIAKCWARYLYNKCTLLIVPNKYVQKKFKSIGVKTPMKKIHLGIDTTQFRPAKDKKAAKKKVKLPDAPIIGFCGRIGREKDLPTLYDAFKEVQKRHPRAKLLIVGAGLDERFLKDPGVVAVGSKDNVVPYLQAMDVFVLPSLIETSSLATMEAMACGLPVVVTPVGSIPEYVQEGMNGMLFDKKNSRALAAKLDVLLHNKAIAAQLGKSARKTIEKDYKFEKTARQIRKVLSLSGSRRR